MPKIELLELLQQDIEDIKGVINYESYGMNKETMKKHARGIILNLQEHLEELIKN